MPLTDAKIRSAKPADKPIRLFDDGGLYLEVSPSGGKWWRFKYHFAGKEKRLSLGVYPAVPLAGGKDKATGLRIEGARDKRDNARRLMGQGIDPGEYRKAAKAATALDEALEVRLAEAEATIAAARAQAVGALHQVASETASNVVSRLLGVAPSPVAVAASVGQVIAARVA